MINAVLWSAVFGYVMVCSFVLAMPDITEGAKQGSNVFFRTMDQSTMPAILKDLLYIGIVLANYLCALAGLTSTSRMVYAFARDGGLPLSRSLRQVHPHHRTPVTAIWTSAVLAVGVFTLLTVGLSFLNSRVRGVRPLTHGTPVVVVERGEPVLPTLRAEHLSLDDLMAAARNEGIERFAEIRLAVLEANGQISFFTGEAKSGANEPTAVG